MQLNTQQPASKKYSQTPKTKWNGFFGNKISYNNHNVDIWFEIKVLGYINKYSKYLQFFVPIFSFFICITSLCLINFADFFPTQLFIHVAMKEKTKWYPFRVQKHA